MDDDRDIIWLLKEAGLALTRYDRDLLRIGNLTPAENHLLGYFLAHENLDLCATDLHQIFGISKPTVSALLKSLKQKGYLQIEILPQDERKKRIQLTAKAYGVRDQIKSVLHDRQDSLCRGISTQEVTILKKILEKLIANMGQNNPIRGNES